MSHDDRPLLLADENIAALDHYFGTVAHLERLPGREIDRKALRYCDYLLVRSVTPVDASLLRGTPVAFVGTATSGIDHVDQSFLAANEIAFAAARGCNAVAVAEYVTAALLDFAVAKGWQAQEKTVAVIGYGEVGRRVTARCQALGFNVMVSDPLIPLPTGIEQATIEEMVSRADVVTLHVPLTVSGDHPTWHLMDVDRLNRMSPDQLLINTSRGPVVDERALLTRLDSDRGPATVLDVFENEPDIPAALLERLYLATPHIAGYSLAAKERGTAMVAEKLYRQLGRIDELPRPLQHGVSLTARLQEDTLAAWHQVVASVYDIRKDDQALRALWRVSTGDSRRQGFDWLRKEYALRNEFSSCRLALPDDKDRTRALALGFEVA